MRGLLDSELLEGPQEIVTHLRPIRYARPVASGDVSAFIGEIEWLCQVWGGAGQPVLPIIGGEIADPYNPLLLTEQVDCINGLRKDLDFTSPPRVQIENDQPWDYPALIIASSEPREKWPVVQVVHLPEDDPWKAIYACTLGAWPERPDTRLCDFVGVESDFNFDDILPVEREIANGSLRDLIERLTSNSSLSPRRASNMFLASGQRPDTSYMGENLILPGPNAARRAAGPNIIVIVTPGSVEDLALLWNLRVAHGDQRVMPIGMPAGEVSSDALRELQKPGRATYFGFGGGKCHVTSTSLSPDDLEGVASMSPAIQAVRYEELLTFGPAPSRPRSHITFWREGRTRFAPFADADQEMMRPTKVTMRQPHMVIDVRVTGYRLPADGVLRGPRFGPHFQAGSAQVNLSNLIRQDTVEVGWLPSWTALAAVAKSRGLRVAESGPGLAAATLIRSLGGVQEIRWLQHRQLIDLFYRLAERSGMAWWKQRWASTHKTLLDAGADPSTLQSAAELLGRDYPAIAPSGEGRDLPFDEFQKIFRNRMAAERWVTWAESRHLLVRGARVQCPDCNSTSWLPMASVPPPVGCLGCGREINHPYNPRELRFTYRIGEALRRVLETDSFGHLLALKWLVSLFDERGLVGAHPGVEFVDPTSGTTLGEADVLLLFSNGDLVPVEVKRRVGGLAGPTAGLLDTLANTLHAPFDLIAVTQPARECEALREFERRLPGRPRLVLTEDQLLDDFVFWSIGEDPFAWMPHNCEQDDQRSSDFVRRLVDLGIDAPNDQLSERLLSGDLND